MKKRLGVIMLLGVLCVPAISNGGSFVFEVKPGYGMQSSAFGYQTGRLTPFVGLDIMAIGAEGTYTDSDYDEYYDWYDDEWYRYETKETIDINGSATLFIPHFGLKYHFADSDADIKPYLLGGVFKSVAFVNVDGSEKTQHYENGRLVGEDDDSVELEDNEKDALKDLLGVWGFNLAFGVVHSFSEHFSVGGEYGFRFYFASTSYDYEDSGDDYNGNGAPDWRNEFETELSASLKLSYAAVVFCFNF